MNVFQITFTEKGKIINVSSFPEKLDLAVSSHIKTFLEPLDIDSEQLKVGVEFKLRLNNANYTCVLVKLNEDLQLLGRNISEIIELEEEINSLNKISDLNMMRLLKTLDELKEAKSAIERTNKFREEFISNISHEMRTPLTAVMGFSEILLDAELNEENAEYVKMIKKSSDDLLIIISDLLDISSIDEGKIEISSVTFDLETLVQRAFKNIQQVKKNDDVELKLEYNVNEKMYLVGDKVRLIQVLFNLLSNSVKYTKEGSVLFTINQLNKNTTKSEIEFVVKDTGVGIAKDKLDSIFKEFYQIKETSYHSPLVNGVGLGLSIVKKLVSLMNGKILVESEIGKGSEFRLVIPFLLSETLPVEVQETVEKKEKELSKKTALVVEDIKTNQMILRKILQNENLKVSIANNGKEAIQNLKNNTHYDIIFMDIQMPYLSGVDTTKIIRNELNVKTPIIAITANALEGEAQKCMKAGMNGYITKPFDQNKVLKELDKVI